MPNASSSDSARANEQVVISRILCIRGMYSPVLYPGTILDDANYPIADETGSYITDETAGG